MCEQKIAGIIEKYRGRPGALIHALTEIQHENHWLPREVMQKVADALEVPFSQVMQIASFYKTFSLTPKGRHEVHVCTGMTCHLRGAAKLMEKVGGNHRPQTRGNRRRSEVHAGGRQLPGQLQHRARTDRQRQALRQDDAGEGGRRTATI